jgi:hypothetical protein
MARFDPLATSLAGSLVRERSFKPREIISLFSDFHTSGVVLPDGTPLAVQEQPGQTLRVEVAEINDHLLRRLEDDISLARELSPRKFEELVADLLARQGYIIELTPE